jgi:hypothetical protein
LSTDKLLKNVTKVRSTPATKIGILPTVLKAVHVLV